MQKAFFIFFLSIICINSYIILPFQELENDEVYDFKDVEELLNELSYLKLYSEFYLGIYPKKLPVFFKNDIDFFYIGENPEDKLKSKDNFNPYETSNLIIFKGKFKHNDIKLRNAATTFNFLITEGDIKTIYKDDKGQIEANNYLSFENINIFFQSNCETNDYAGYMGFSYPNKSYDGTNFIKELKDKALIANTVWSVYFPDIDEDT